MNPLVSVYCLAYNHEKYIRSALEGFVSQKTSFPFEVIVHDDASTDNTAEIIQEYEKKYPDIIKPIYQTENQYSKHIFIVKDIIFPKLKGKYIAVCEGDDYWCDNNKLQCQVDWLEANPDYSLCVHNTKILDVSNGKEGRFNKSDYDKDISIEDILQGGGAQFHTSSFMYRAEFMRLPDEFRVRGVGDYPRAIYLALSGKVRYLHAVMSVYRLNVEGSYTRRLITAPFNIREEQHKNIIQMLHNVDVFSDGRYSECIKNVIKQREFSFLLSESDLRSIKSKYPDCYRKLDCINKIKLWMRYKHPKLMNLYHKVTQ